MLILLNILHQSETNFYLIFYEQSKFLKDINIIYNKVNILIP